MKIFKVIFGCIMILFIVLVSVFRDDLDSSHACSNLARFKRTAYNGIVLKKYIDQKNHRAPTIQFEKSTYVLPRDTNEFYSYIKPGDSLVKRKGTDFFEVYR